MNKQQHLSDLIPDSKELEGFIKDYANREVLGTNYIPTELFVLQEISHITEKVLGRKLMSIEVHVGPSQTAKPFMHAVCATMVFENLTSGKNPTVTQIIEAARAEAEASNRSNKQFGIGVLTGDGFEALCYTWIKTGVAFVYYIRYLYQKMKFPALMPQMFIINVINNNGDGNVINTGNDNNIGAHTTINKLGNWQAGATGPGAFRKWGENLLALGQHGRLRWYLLGLLLVVVMVSVLVWHNYN